MLETIVYKWSIELWQMTPQKLLAYYNSDDLTGLIDVRKEWEADGLIDSTRRVDVCLKCIKKWYTLRAYPVVTNGKAILPHVFSELPGKATNKKVPVKFHGEFTTALNRHGVFWR